MFAAFYMCVKLNDNDILKLDVEEIEKVLYEKFSSSTDSIPTTKKSYMHIKQKNGDSARYDVNQVEEVFYEFFNDSTVIDTTIVDTTITDTTIVDTTIIVEPIDTLRPALKYRILSNSTVSLSGFDKGLFIDEDGIILEKEINVPAKVLIDGVEYTVTEIGNSVFSQCSGLIGINLPSTITSIQDSAFYDCIGLNDINIPSNVSYIGEEAFQGCTRLTGIMLPSSVKTIREWAFYGCERLEILIDNSEDKVEIGKDAFKWCKSVTFTKENTSQSDTVNSVFKFRIISDSTAEVVRDSAKLASEESVIIPNKIQIGNRSYNVVRISDSVFFNLKNLKNIVIPSSIYSLGNESFAYCSSLKNIAIPNSVTEIKDKAFYGCDSLISLTIPSSVDSIGHSAFANCRMLSRLMILQGVTIIGKNAFENCSSLTSAVLPDSLVYIEEEAFKNCSRLTTVTIPSSVTNIGARAFYGCNNLNVTIDNTRDKVTTGEQTFEGCKTIRYTKEDSSVVDTSATPLRFRRIDNSSVEVVYSSSYEMITDSVVIPSFVSMGDSVFAVTKIGYAAFIHCNMTSLFIPANVSSIKDSIIFACNNLAVINIAPENPNYSSANNIIYDKNKTILIAAASRISGEIKLDSTVTTIKHSAFYGCDSLTKITIPESVTTIDYQAFYGCKNLNAVVENSQYDIEVASNAFADCKSVVFTKDDPSVVNATDTNVKFLILSDSTAEVTNCTKTQMYGAITVPEKVRIDKKVYTVVRIGNSAFENCSLMTSIEIPETIASIGDNAFYFCTGMSKINIPEAVTSIGETAFSDCSNLTKLELSGNVTSIGIQAFAYCKKLDLVINNLEENIEIGANAFHDCKSVKFATENKE